MYGLYLIDLFILRFVYIPSRETTNSFLYTLSWSVKVEELCCTSVSYLVRHLPLTPQIETSESRLEGCCS